MLIADALNGCNVLIQCDPTYLRLMMGDSGAIKDAAIIGQDRDGRVLLRGSTVCSGLEHEIYDAIRLNGLDEKWEVNGSDLIHKIRELTPELREQLIRAIGEVWQRNDEHFERDLEALERVTWKEARVIAIGHIRRLGYSRRMDGVPCQIVEYDDEETLRFLKTEEPDITLKTQRLINQAFARELRKRGAVVKYTLLDLNAYFSWLGRYELNDNPANRAQFILWLTCA